MKYEASRHTAFLILGYGKKSSIFLLFIAPNNISIESKTRKNQH